MRCAQCERDVPDGTFCTSCGARQGPGGTAGDGRRLDRLAASPGGQVASTGIFSTLFPHLGHDAVNEFKWVFLGGVVALAVLALVGLITAAIILSAFLVPVLYLMYLYEVRIYRDAPVPVVGLTVGGGLLIGAVVTLVANQLVVSMGDVRVTPFGTTVDVTGLLAGAVLLPLIAEIVKPIPAFLLRGRRDVSQTVDGLVLGVAAGLGFSAAATILRFAEVLTSSSINTSVAGWIYPLLSIAIFAPLMAGSTTGLITAALWRRRGNGRLGRLELGGVVLALVSAVAFVLVDRLLVGFGLPRLLSVGWQILCVGVVILYLRMVLHAALLEEAGNVGFAYTTCPSCRADIIAAGFCPSCGIALSAVPASVREARTATAPDGKVGT
jgi:RsiW-degrading membrane proteinase PrsW (M82 family)